MPNWCWNTITIEGDIGTLNNIDFIMRSDGYERSGGDDPKMGQPMRLVPMPEVLQGTRSPAPTGDFDADGKRMEWVNDPKNEYWTLESYKEAQKEHYDLLAKARQAEAETGFTDWYDWAVNNWGTKWSMEVVGYTYEPEAGAIYISGNTAWSPPTELLRRISDKFPVTIHISYAEEGMDFIGASIMKMGQVWDSCDSFSDNLPDDFDWENDDAYDIYQDVRDRLIDLHENIVFLKAKESTQFMNV